MPSKKNIDQLAVIQEKMTRAKSAIIADYTGLNASEQVDLRAKISEAGGEMNISKNTLIKIALMDRVDEITDDVVKALEGPTAIIYGYEDAVGATKAVVDFTKDTEHLSVKMGVLAGSEDAKDKVLTVDQIKALADLPSKDQLRAQVVGTLQAPISGFVRVLAGNISGLMNVLNAIKEQKEA